MNGRTDEADIKSVLILTGRHTNMPCTPNYNSRLTVDLHRETRVMPLPPLLWFQQIETGLKPISPHKAQHDVCHIEHQHDLGKFSHIVFTYDDNLQSVELQTWIYAACILGVEGSFIVWWNSLHFSAAVCSDLAFVALPGSSNRRNSNEVDHPAFNQLQQGKHIYLPVNHIAAHSRKL